MFEKATACSLTFIINFGFFIITPVRADIVDNVTVYFRLWPFSIIQKECESNFLYNYGYTSVLTSHVQPNIQVSDFEFNDLFRFDTSLGSEEEFKSMVSSCYENMVRIYTSIKLITPKQKAEFKKCYKDIKPALRERRKINELEKQDSMLKEKRRKQGRRAFVNDQRKRKMKNVKYLMEMILLCGFALRQNEGYANVWMKSFQGINYKYSREYLKNAVLEGTANEHKIIRKLCQIKYDQEARSVIVGFINRLLDSRITGIRIQDAKYVSPITLQNILRDVQAYAVLRGLEIIVILNEMKYTNGYERLGVIEDESYGEKTFEAVEDVKLNRLITHNKAWPSGWSGADVTKNVKTIISKKVLPPKMKKSKIDKLNFKIAVGLMLSNPYGSPIIESPFWKLKSRVEEFRGQGKNIDMDEICINGKYCAHRKKYIREMSLFKIVTRTEGITSTGTLSNNIMYVNRGDKGVAIFVHNKKNPGDKDLNGTEFIQTELPPGFYCDVITGYADPQRHRCWNVAVIEVDADRKIKVNQTNTPLQNIIVIHEMSQLHYIRLDLVTIRYHFYSVSAVNPEDMVLDEESASDSESGLFSFLKRGANKPKSLRRSVKGPSPHAKTEFVTTHATLKTDELEKILEKGVKKAKRELKKKPKLARKAWNWVCNKVKKGLKKIKKWLD